MPFLASTLHAFLAFSLSSGARNTRFQPLRSLPLKRSIQPFGSLSRALGTDLGLASSAWVTAEKHSKQTPMSEILTVMFVSKQADLPCGFVRISAGRIGNR